MSVLSTHAPERRVDAAPRAGHAPRLRLVDAAPRRRVRVGLVGTVCLGALFLALFALAAMHSLVVQAQFELDRVDEQVSSRQEEIDVRRVQVAELESPTAIVAAAQELGLVPPTDIVYLDTIDRSGPDAGGSKGSVDGDEEAGARPTAP